MLKTREELKNYCLRALGHPLIKINVDESQLNDRIDDALEYFRLYHYDGIQSCYIKIQITQDNIDNGYIEIPANVYGITRVFSINSANASASNLFSPQYQMRVEDMYSLGSASLSYYYTALEHISTIDIVLNGHPQFDFNRLMDKLFIHMNWQKKVEAGDYILLEASKVIEPEEYNKLWSEPWFRAYCIALFKIQWGNNLSKFQNVSLPGGVAFDAQAIKQEGMDEKQRLEDDLMSKTSPLNVFVG